MTSSCGYLCGQGGVGPYLWRRCGMLWLTLSLILISGGAAWGLTPLLHMANFCSKSVHVNDSLLLDLTEDLPADRVSVGYLTCVTTVNAPPGTRLIAHVLQMAICDKADTPDRLHIFDVSLSGRERRLTPSTGLYGVLERPFLIYNTAGIIVPDFKSLGPRMRLNYQGKPTVIYRGFRLLITAFNDPDTSGSCPRDTMFCPYAGTCVPLHVRCDGLPNCGLDDNQDERNCEREDVVTNIIEEYSTRTAVIAGVTGSLVFLACAAMIAVFIVRYNRQKHYSGPSPTVHYTSRDGGRCRVKDETEDLSRLYAPPSYEDIMTPGPTSRYHGPPPAYHTVAAIHVQRGYDSSDDESVRTSRNSRQSKLKAPHAAQEQDPPPTLELKRMRSTCPADSEEDVRMHGTWPSDTDEEEEVRARRRRKGGKGKGKQRRNSQGASASESSAGKATEDDGTKKELGKLEFRDIRSPSSLSSPASPCEAGSGSATATSKSECESSPLRKGLKHEECSCGDASGLPYCGGEAVSETESQLASSKRNSRTESNSRSESPASSKSDNPIKSLENSPTSGDRPIKNRDKDDVPSIRHIDSEVTFEVNLSHNLVNGVRRLASAPATILEISADKVDSPSKSPTNSLDVPPRRLDAVTGAVHTPLTDDGVQRGTAKFSPKTASQESLTDQVQGIPQSYKNSSFVDLNPAASKNRPQSASQNGGGVKLDVQAVVHC